MSVMAAAVVRQLGLMHLVSGLETYKTTLGAITQALNRISEVPIKVRGVKCMMTFMVVDTDSYDILLGLDLLIKIGAIVDVEQGLIQVRRGPGADVEVLPLTMVNLIQRSDIATDDYNNDCAEKHTFGKSEAMEGASYLSQQSIGEQIAELESESDSGSSKDSDEGNQTVGTIEEEFEFGNTEFENLVLSEGPQQILQFMLQDKAADFMKEEITNNDDYANWIQWAADAEQRKQKPSEARNAGQESDCQRAFDALKKALVGAPIMHMEWCGNKRQLRAHTEYRECRPGIKHWHNSDPHHLFMIDLVTATDSGEEATPSAERLGITEDEDLKVEQSKQKHWKDQVRYYNRRQQLELVLAAQGMSEVGGHELNLAIVDEADKCGGEMKDPNIW
ncbi:unnamed protein product [Sphagnum balticum]